MRLSEMMPNALYVVTAGSYNETFCEGEHVYLDRGNTVSCIEANGFLEKEVWQEYDNEVVVEFDWENAEATIASLHAEIARIKDIMAAHIRPSSNLPQ